MTDAAQGSECLSGSGVLRVKSRRSFESPAYVWRGDRLHREAASHRLRAELEGCRLTAESTQEPDRNKQAPQNISSSSS